MNKILSILIVEDDQAACKRITDCVDEYEDMKVVGTTNNAKHAIEYIRDNMPEVVILDLELHMGSGSGLDVLEGLKDIFQTIKPYILVTTNNSSAVTYETARRMGADFIMSKHQEDYSEKKVVDFIRMMQPAIMSDHALSRLDNTIPEPLEQINKRITRRIMAELEHVGISQKAVGYQYLIDAITLLIDGPKHNVCSIIGEKYGKTESSVERAMQNAICRAWRSADIEDLLQYYTAKINSDRGIPTITEFMHYYANKIRNEY